jgi:hypothetical protein
MKITFQHFWRWGVCHSEVPVYYNRLKLTRTLYLTYVKSTIKNRTKLCFMDVFNSRASGQCRIESTIMSCSIACRKLTDIGSRYSSCRRLDEQTNIGLFTFKLPCGLGWRSVTLWTHTQEVLCSNSIIQVDLLTASYSNHTEVHSC